MLRSHNSKVSFVSIIVHNIVQGELEDNVRITLCVDDCYLKPYRPVR